MPLIVLQMENPPPIALEKFRQKKGLELDSSPDFNSRRASGLATTNTTSI